MNNHHTNKIQQVSPPLGAGGAVWLASYPKSGNTWFRLFLMALLNESEVNINDMETNDMFSKKVLMESVLDLDSDLLRPSQIAQYQRLTFEHLSRTANKPLFIKIHDAFTFSETEGLPLIPENATKMAIYIIRNPLDVTLSLANHVGFTIDKTIEKLICNPKGRVGHRKNSAYHQFYQPLGNWSMHVASWLERPNFPVHFVQYEDLKAQPFETFKAAVVAMDLEVTDEQIKKAIEATEFEKLKKQEEERGFVERHIPTAPFFHKGQVGRWKEELTAEQIEKIRAVNEHMMRRFGYW